MGTIVVVKTLVILGSYFLGAIPFGFLIAKYGYHVDIRQVGSGNPGATNVWRTLGKKAGISTLFLDMMKGVIPVVVARALFPTEELFSVVAGLVSIVGHNWSIFLKGKGGKGVATSAGVFMALIPLQALLAVITFAILFLSTGYVSVGSIFASIALVVGVFMFASSTFIQVTVSAAAVMVIVKHVPNIKRLINGTENRVKFR